MDVDVQFRPGGKHILASLLAAVKDFSPTPSINFVFTPRGLSVRFCAHPTDDRAVVSFSLDAPMSDAEAAELAEEEISPVSPICSVASDGVSWNMKRDSSSNTIGEGLGNGDGVFGNIWSTGPDRWDSRRASGGGGMGNPAGAIGSGLPSWGQPKWEANRRASGGSTVSPTSAWGAPGSRLSASSSNLSPTSTAPNISRPPSVTSISGGPNISRPPSAAGLSIGPNISRPPSAASISSVSTSGASRTSEGGSDMITSRSIWPDMAHPGVPGWTSVFSKYECRRPQVTIGLNPRLLAQQLMLVDDEDTVTIRAEMGDAGVVMLYELYFESPDGGKKCLYEMDAIPRLDRLGPLPRPRYHHVCQVASHEFARIVGALGDTSDKVAITANKSSIKFCSTGSEGTLQVGLVQRPPKDGEKIPRFKIHAHTSSVRQTFDARYLRGFTLATPLTPAVILHLGTGRCPLRVTFPVVVEIDPSSTVGGSGGEAMTLSSGKPDCFRHTSPAENHSGKPRDDTRKIVVGRVEYVLGPENEKGMEGLRA